MQPIIWGKSRFCDTSSCVSVAFEGDEVWVRDDKSPDGPALHFTIAEWLAFLRGAKEGQFDIPIVVHSP